MFNKKLQELYQESQLKVEQVKLGDVQYHLKARIWQSQEHAEYWENKEVAYRNELDSDMASWCAGKREGCIGTITALQEVLSLIEKTIR